jgi:hypothetical protein
MLRSHAIPMLTGWDLAYTCNDRHVKEVGIWIDQWSYQPPALGVGGTLRLTLSYILRGGSAAHYRALHNVGVLGLRPVPGIRGPAGGPQ